MGYTHYWEKPQGTKGYDKALPIIKKILKRHKDIIQKEYDSKRVAIANDDHIFFNGIGDDGHETFTFGANDSGFDFCKTARKPYDLVVCECLLVLNHFIPMLGVSSDGDQDEWDLAEDNVLEHYGIKKSIFFKEEA